MEAKCDSKTKKENVEFTPWVERQKKFLVKKPMKPSPLNLKRKSTGVSIDPQNKFNLESQSSPGSPIKMKRVKTYNNMANIDLLELASNQ